MNCTSRVRSSPQSCSNSRRKQCRRAACVAKAKQEDDLDAMMAEDLQQFSAQATKTAQASGLGGEEESGSGIKEIVDKVLIADFFFILFILAWFIVGVGAQTLGNSTGLLDVWYSLWQLVFQPALGVLMLGALASGLLGKKDDDKK